MQNKYFAQLAALSILWGATFLFTRVATPELGPSLTAAGRIGLGAATLALIMTFTRHRWPWEHWRALTVLAALSIAGPHFLFAWSSQYLPAGYSAVLSVTSVMFGTFTSAWLREDTLTRSKVLGCIAGFAGVALVVQLGPMRPTTELVAAAMIAICGSALSGSSAPLLKRATQKMEPLAITAAMHVLALAIMLPAALWTLPQAHFTPAAVASVAIMGIFTSGLAYWQYMRIVQQVSPVAALSSTFMATISGIVWGHLVLDEEFTGTTYLGGLLVLSATVLVTGFNPWRRPMPPVEPPKP
ncbi:MAG: EamA family transporter [Rhodoferax sp.]|nr:EamA family transporter [Rhodoferax sp.]HQZ07657.1 DMT family transporter [Burkholderiaceae bacterium]HRA63234.1 DMT family transporter [Burkholderiaceae bacterium]